MITPYELAYLSNDTYREDPMVRPASYSMTIPQAGTWGVGAHDGVSNNFFCTKYIKTGSFENVIAFRGTENLTDVAVDVVHMLTRSSPYINAALSFMRRFADRNTIVTGHSLGGFIAITMAFHQTVKVAAFNPPWMNSDIAGLADNLRAASSQIFRSSRIIVYQSNTDVLTTITHGNRIVTPNVNFIRIGACGYHNLDPIVENFRRNRNYPIRW